MRTVGPVRTYAFGGIYSQQRYFSVQMLFQHISAPVSLFPTISARFYAELVLSLSLHLFERDRNTKLCELNVSTLLWLICKCVEFCMTDITTHTHRNS